jgi:UV DNA damage repair endonuclease
MKLGFACKYHHPDRTLTKKAISEIERPFNMTGTTAKWLSDNPTLAKDRLVEIAHFNAQCILNLISWVSTRPEPLRMVRLSSNTFPCYTHRDWENFYKNEMDYSEIEKILGRAGDLARRTNTKVSMHPGQFTVLASDRPDVVTESIKEFEYHADIIRMMGFGRSKLDFKCNVHLSGKGGAEQFRKTYKKLSNVARRTITLENDEFSADLDHLLPLADLVGIVLDIHHYWIYNGDYIQHDDPRLDIVRESWQGVRPTLHYSYSPDDYVSHIRGVQPDLETLMEEGYPKSRLRKHSDDYPNVVANRYALDFLRVGFDIMCECKNKNVAVDALYKQAVRTGYF